MSWIKLIRSELHAIFTNAPLLITVFGGVLIYSFLYPLPYLNQSPVNQKIAVINLDNSQLSRKIERMINASPKVSVVKRLHHIDQAKQLIEQKKITGFFVIPKNFYRDLLLEKSPHLMFAGDASYFLVYGTVVEGLVRSSSTLSAEVKVGRLVLKGENITLASSQYTAIGLNMKPVFNASLGYLNYIVPAVFILILHQTLLIATGLLTTGQYNNGMGAQLRNQNTLSYWLNYSAWSLLLTRTCVFIVIYSVLFMYYFGYSFQSYGISRLASIVDLFSIAFPFLLATSFFGILLGLVLPRKELVTLVVLLSSMPLVFSAGFVWPTENIPSLINISAQFFPSTPAINGFLRLNQMGDSIENLVDIKQQLYTLALLYGLASFVLMTNKQQKAKAIQ